MKMKLVVIAFLAILVTTWLPSRVYADDVPACPDNEASLTPNGKSIVEQLGCDQTCLRTTKTTDPAGTTTQLSVNRPCQVNDFINLFIYLSKWGMSVLAFLSVLMMVYGGFQFVTAAGRSSKVDEGKRVITGTIIGVTIALTAYVLINTTVTAITGYKVTSQNPFGVIGSVFGNVSGTIQKQTNYEQAFSGPKTKTGTSTTTTPPAGSTTGCADATSDWDKTCTPGNLYSHCADPVDGGSSDIKVMQKDLNDLGCPKIDVDGCFGAQTIDAVRRFQIANKLPPSGMIDSSTRAKIIAGGSSCTLVLSGGVDIAAAVAGTLPAAADLSAEDAAKSDTGCCVVKSTTNDYYCLDNIPYRACIGLGESNDFYSNGGSTSNTCNSSSMPTSTRCGYCKVAPVTTSGFFCNQQVSEYWCTNVISPLVGSSGDTYDTFFNTGLCNGAPACNGMCTNTITPNE